MKYHQSDAFDLPPVPVTGSFNVTEPTPSPRLAALRDALAACQAVRDMHADEAGFGARFCIEAIEHLIELEGQ